jgi:hypothetical protein
MFQTLHHLHKDKCITRSLFFWTFIPCEVQESGVSQAQVNGNTFNCTTITILNKYQDQLKPRYLLPLSRVYCQSFYIHTVESDQYHVDLPDMVWCHEPNFINTTMEASQRKLHKKYYSLLKKRGPDSGTPTLHWKQFLEQFCNE